MARPTQRRKSTREQAEIGFQSPGLQTNRRFFVAGGYDKNVRAARALENAFQVGAETYEKVKRQQNAEGQAQARAEAGSGASERDADNEQAGYNRAWDELDAEFDYNLATKELPELLRGANWEELDEGSVQGVISNYMKETFGGAERSPQSAYTQFLGPKLLELETELIGQHRDMQVARIQEEQRSKILANAKSQFLDARAFDDDALPDYETLFARTGQFFDGKDKKVVFWETVYDLAIEAGDPTIISKMPKQFGSVPSGIDDPHLQDAHRAAESQAATAGARQAEKKAKATEEANKKEVMDLQILITEKVQAGKPIDEEIRRLRANPEANFEDITGAMRFGQSQLDENDSRSMDLPKMSALVDSIYDGTATRSDLFAAWDEGVMGSGPQAYEELKTLQAAVRRVAQENARGGSSRVGTFRSQVRDFYNPQLDQFTFDKTMHHVRIAAVSKYNEKIDEGVDPAKAFAEVREEFDPIVDLNSASAKSQTTAERELGIVPAKDIKKVASGAESFDAVFAGLSEIQIENRLHTLRKSNDLSDAEIEVILEQLYN